MYRATFIFKSNTPINHIISELLTDPHDYDKIVALDNGGARFEIEYNFNEFDPQNEMIAIGNGSIDSDDANEEY
jgi:hypothetical protein